MKIYIQDYDPIFYKQAIIDYGIASKALVKFIFFWYGLNEQMSANKRSKNHFNFHRLFTDILQEILSKT